MTGDKRQSQRSPRRFRVQLWEYGRPQPFVGFTENVSPGGLFVTVPRRLGPGNRVRLEIQGDARRTFVAEGVVTHSRAVAAVSPSASETGIGISLLPFADFLEEAGLSQEEPRLWRPGWGGLRARDELPESAQGGWRQTGSVASGRVTRSHGSEMEAERADPDSRPVPHTASPDTASRPSSSLAGRTGAEPGGGARATADRPLLGRLTGDWIYPVRFASRLQFVAIYEEEIRQGIFYLATDSPAPNGTRVELEMVPPAARRPIRFSAEVVDNAARPAQGGQPGAMLIRFLQPSVAIETLGLFVRRLK